MRARNARLAGIAFVLYITTEISDIFLYAHVSSGIGMAAKLASIAQHVPQMRLAIVLSILKILYALILAVTLYALTRDVDNELGLLAMTCRVVEGVLNAVPATVRFGLLSIAVAGVATASSDAGAQQASLLQKVAGWSGAVGGTIFAVGSALFAYLFLRGRLIPPALAWLGIAGSLLIVPMFVLQAFQLVGRTGAWLISIPILLFEVILAFWLVFKGVGLRTGGAEQ